jgi:hypothetical protein
MTTRDRVDSPVIRRIFEAYKMEDSDIQDLYASIERQLTVTYRQVIASQLNLYGCQKLVSDPIDSQSVKWIQAKARADSESIARTYETQLMNQIQRIRSANKFSNRFAYIRALDEWAAKRNSHKVPSISLNTMTSAREYAAQRFRDENGIEGKMIFVGPPPVCKACMKLKALGAVSVARAKKYGDSQHINCPHRWEILIPKKIDCNAAWTG